MIGKVIEGHYEGASVNKLPDKNVLFIQTEDGTKIALSKSNVISIDDVTDQYPSYGRKVMMVMWNDFETSLIQIGMLSNSQGSMTKVRSTTEDTDNSFHPASPPHLKNEDKNHTQDFPNTRTRKNKFIIIIALVLILCLSIGFTFISKKSGNNVIESELIGTFVGGSNIFTRTINFRADGTFYEEHHSVLGVIQTRGTYVVKKDVILVTDSDGDIEEWTFSYNKDNGNLVLYYLDTAYVKSK